MKHPPEQAGVVARQVAARREHILEVTREFIAENGYESLNMRDLAELCGVSVPTLYRQFGGKQALVRAAVQDHFGSRILDPEPARPEQRGHARLLQLLDACGADVRRLPGYYRQLMSVFVAEQHPGAPAGTPGVGMPINSQVIGVLRQSLREMREDGHLHEWVDIDLMAERVASETMIAGIQWAMGMLSSRGYHSALIYASCMMLLAGARGEAAQALRDRIDQTPRSARLRSAGPKR